MYLSKKKKLSSVTNNKSQKETIILNTLHDNKEKINYKDFISIENLKIGLKRTKSNVAPGIDGEIKKDITEK